MFEIRNLRYKDILYIERMNIKKGITTSITGRSGSGKTTLLKMLNKMISPDEGTILYEKKPVKNIDSLDLRRRVVMLPQSPVIFPGDIRDNLLKGLRFSEKPDAPDSRMNEIISELHLNKSLDDDISQLSGGEKQRIALARVILMDPEVYLLDEPSSALDEETEKTMIDFLVKHSRINKKTLIMVTHSKKIASEYSDEIAEIENGRLVKSGRVDA